jgi:hypothetical protein
MKELCLNSYVGFDTIHLRTRSSVDRASRFGREGRGFKSLRVYKLPILSFIQFFKKLIIVGGNVFLICFYFVISLLELSCLNM